MPHAIKTTDITMHAGFLPHNDAGYGGMRWITAEPPDQPGTSSSGLPVRLQARQDTPGRCDPQRQE